MGTAFVESLTSYVLRLSNAHHVFPYKMVLDEIHPQLLKEKTPHDLSKSSTKLTRSWWDSASTTANAANQQTEVWVRVLDGLTKREDLRFLTLLTYKGALPYRGLIKSTAAACFECYNAGLNAENLYNALIWQIELVLLCPMHGCRLQTACPYHDCGKPLTSLGPRHNIGFCPHCFRWLGTNHLVSDPGLSLSAREEQAYYVNSIGELLTAAPTLKLPPECNNITVAIKRGIDELFDGNGKRLAMALGLHHKTLYELRDGTQLPQIRTLLNLCRLLGITPLKLLTSEVSRLPLNRTDVEISGQKTEHVRYRRLDRNSTKARLDEAIQSNQSPPPSLANVAETLGYDQTFLSHHFPDECRIISQRHAEFVSQKAESSKEQEQAVLHDLIIKLHEQGIYPSSKRIGHELGGIFRNPDMRAYYRTALKGLGYKK